MTEVEPAAPQLADLASAMRPDWDRDETGNALVAAHAAGWSFARTFREVARLLLIADSSPRDLRFAAGETRIEKPGHLDGDARSQALAAAEEATRLLREQADARERGGVA